MYRYKPVHFLNLKDEIKSCRRHSAVISMNVTWTTVIHAANVNQKASSTEALGSP